MHNFKVGDKVRRVRGGFGGMRAGDTDVVVALAGSASLNLESHGVGHDADNFELAEAPAAVDPANEGFKPGDRVQRRAGFGRNAGRDEGEPFTISRVSGVWASEDGKSGSHNVKYLERVEEIPTVPEHKFKVGQLVRRIANPMGCRNYKLGSEFRVVRLDTDGDVYDDADDIHEQQNIELVPEPVKPAIVQTVTSTYVAAGEFISKQAAAMLRWKESDDEQAIEIDIPHQECNESDLREFVAVLIELADKLAATKR